MAFFQIALCLALTVMVPGIVNGGGPVLRFEDNNEDAVNLNIGTKSYPLVWESDTSNADYTLFEITFWNPVTKAETLLGKVDDMTTSNVADGYNLNVTMSGSYRKLTLTIDTVDSKDDGVFMAIAISNKDSQMRESITKNVTVVKPLTMLHLQFHERGPVSSKPEDAVQVEAGVYPVKCIAEGSNPATLDVSLHLDGNSVNLDGEPRVEAMEGDIRQYKTTVMGNVTLGERTAGYEVECVAVDMSGQTLSTKLDLKVMVPEREDVKCHEATAKEGDASVTLVCIVDHANVNVTGLAFQIGKTGEVIQQGQQGQNNDTVTVNTATPGKSTVTLTLSKVENRHFDLDYYLLVTTSDGQVIKETLKLENSDGDSGNCPTASMGWILLLAIAALLSRH